jgi:endonuclease YncB( thermonuclease family)
MIRALLILTFGVLATSAQGAELVRGEAGVVAHVVDGDTFVLDGGLEVRLIGLQAPKLPLGRRGFPTWPFAPESRAALVELVKGRTVELSYGGARRDRYGRALAQVHLADGTWVQGEMIRWGFARVYSFKDNRACVSKLLSLEAEARAAQRGLWGLNAYRVRAVPDTYDEIDTYQLVEGIVREAAEVKGRVFLNFGDDWRTDFTATVAPGDVAAFDEEGIDLTSLGGKKVRLRGWLTSWNGPNMVLTHPEQLERPAFAEPPEEATMSPCVDGRLID